MPICNPDSSDWPSFSTMAPHFFLHGQGCITGAQGVVFVRQRCAKKRHDAVTQHLVDGSFIAMDRVHHDTAEPDRSVSALLLDRVPPTISSSL